MVEPNLQFLSEESISSSTIKNKKYKSIKLDVLNTRGKVLHEFESLRQASKTFNITRHFFVKLAKTGEVFHDKFKFVIKNT